MEVLLENTEWYNAVYDSPRHPYMSNKSEEFNSTYFEIFEIEI